MTLAFLGAGTAAVTAIAKERVAIQSADIASAMSSAGVHVTPDQIERLSDLFATRPPKLKLVALDPMDGDRVKARLRCESTKVCLPFYVLIHWQDAADFNAAMASWRLAKDVGPHLWRRDELLVHSGKDATMIFDGDQVRMSLPVVCLQNGSRGQRVRVMSKDRKRTFVAQVAGAGIVRAGWKTR